MAPSNGLILPLTLLAQEQVSTQLLEFLSLFAKNLAAGLALCYDYPLDGFLSQFAVPALRYSILQRRGYQSYL